MGAFQIFALYPQFTLFGSLLCYFFLRRFGLDLQPCLWLGYKLVKKSNQTRQSR
jgi:hypothetical protein